MTKSLNTMHTPSPWYGAGANVEHPSHDIADICSCDPASMGQAHLERSYDEMCANARRIAVCVNACDGIDDPGTAIADMCALLREAVSRVQDLIDGNENAAEDLAAWADDARDAIAKAEGRK